MKKQKPPKKPDNLPDYLLRLKIIRALVDGSVIVSDAIMRRYFGVSWCEYKKKYNK